MTVRIVRLRKRRREEGIALVVVLLFTAIVLTIVVSTTATLALGARGGGVNERAAYQALLAAESGLNTFAARVEKFKQKSPANVYKKGTDLKDWLENKFLKDPDNLAKPDNAAFTFENIDQTKASFTLVIDSKVGIARKTLLADYSFQFFDPTPPDAAVLSIPPINGNGSAKIYGNSTTPFRA